MNMIDLEYFMNPIFANLHVKAEKDDIFNTNKDLSWNPKIELHSKDKIQDYTILMRSQKI